MVRLPDQRILQRDNRWEANLLHNEGGVCAFCLHGQGGYPDFDVGFGATEAGACDI